MKQIRFGVFETNSSSTHSIVVVSAEEARGLEKGNYLIYQGDVLPEAEAKAENLEVARKHDIPEEIVKAYEEGEIDIKEFEERVESLKGWTKWDFFDCFYTTWYRYNDYMADRCLESDETSYNSKSGDKIKIFCWWGTEC